MPSGPGRCRHLNAVALRAVMFNRAGEIDCVGIDRDAYRLHREGGLAADADAEKQRGKAKQADAAIVYLHSLRRHRPG